jgi:DNA polymerase-3 subunit gamma/tau
MLGRAAEGSVRDSLSLLDQAIAYGAGEVRSAQVATMLGALDQSYLHSIVGCLADGNAKQLVGEIEQLAMRSISFDMTLKDLAGLLARIALVQNVGDCSAECTDGAAAVNLASRLRPDQVQLFYQIALLGRRDLALAPDEQCGFTMSMLRMLAFTGATGSGATAARGDNSAAAQEIPARYAAPVSTVPVPVASPPVVRTQTVNTTYQSDCPSEIANWTEFVAQLKLAGMAGMLAKQCEFQSFAGGVLELVVPPAQKHLADRPYQEKLRSELMPKLGTNLRLNIRVADASGASLAAHEDRVRSQQQADAEGAIEHDPFIRDLRQEFGAEVLPDSIRPAGQH